MTNEARAMRLCKCLITTLGIRMAVGKCNFAACARMMAKFLCDAWLSHCPADEQGRSEGQRPNRERGVAGNTNVLEIFTAMWDCKC